MRTCVVCGCTEETPCEQTTEAGLIVGACHWAFTSDGTDVCSMCVGGGDSVQLDDFDPDPPLDDNPFDNFDELPEATDL